MSRMASGNTHANGVQPFGRVEEQGKQWRVPTGGLDQKRRAVVLPNNERCGNHRPIEGAGWLLSASGPDRAGDCRSPYVLRVQVRWICRRVEGSFNLNLPPSASPPPSEPASDTCWKDSTRTGRKRNLGGLRITRTSGQGQYRFLVSARTGNGPWSKSASSVPCTLEPHFYQTDLFLALLRVEPGRES